LALLTKGDAAQEKAARTDQGLLSLDCKYTPQYPTLDDLKPLIEWCITRVKQERMMRDSDWLGSFYQTQRRIISHQTWCL